MALQYMLRTHVQVADVFVVRLGRSVQRLSTMKGATQLTLIHWTSDDHPDLQVMELPSQDIKDVAKLTGHAKNKLRLMLIIQMAGCEHSMDDSVDLADGLMPNSANDDTTADDIAAPPSLDDRLTTIEEGSNEDGVDDIDEEAALVQAYQAELDSEAPLQEASAEDAIPPFPVEVALKAWFSLARTRRTNCSFRSRRRMELS